MKTSRVNEDENAVSVEIFHLLNILARVTRRIVDANDANAVHSIHSDELTQKQDRKA